MLFRRRRKRSLLTKRFQEAVTYASRLHRAQVRKGTSIPYVAHLMAVCSLVIEDGGTEDEAIAALLHDALEDQPRGGKTAVEIRRRFGEQVLKVVEECTDSFTHPKPPWRQRKERYVAKARSHGPEARRVSIADKLHNVRSIVRDYRATGRALWDRRNAGRDDTMWYYRALVEAYRDGGASILLDELDRAVREMEETVASG